MNWEKSRKLRPLKHFFHGEKAVLKKCGPNQPPTIRVKNNKGPLEWTTILVILASKKANKK